MASSPADGSTMPAAARGPIVVPFALGSAAPRDIVTYAEGLGEVVFLVPQDDPNAVAVQPVLESLARIVKVATADPAAALAALADDGIRPAGTVTFVDHLLPIVAAIGEGYGLPALDPASAALCTSKFEQRTALNRAGVGAVRTARMVTGDAIPVGVPLPAILKPERGAASVNTLILRSAEEVAAASAGLARGETYVLEELLVGAGHPDSDWLGDYCSVESAVIDGAITHLGISDRTPIGAPARETGILYPSALSDEHADAVQEVAADAIRALGITTGLVHTEVKHTADGPRIIEVNSRLGGQVHELMRRAGACDPIRLALEICLGRTEPPAVAPARRVVAHFWVLPPLNATRVLKLPGRAALRRLPGVVSAQVFKPAGTPVDWREGTLSTHLVAMIEADDHAGLRSLSAGLFDFLDSETEWQRDETPALAHG